MVRNNSKCLANIHRCQRRLVLAIRSEFLYCIHQSKYKSTSQQCLNSPLREIKNVPKKRKQKLLLSAFKPAIRVLSTKKSRRCNLSGNSFCISIPDARRKLADLCRADRIRPHPHTCPKMMILIAAVCVN